MSGFKSIIVVAIHCPAGVLLLVQVQLIVLVMEIVSRDSGALQALASALDVDIAVVGLEERVVVALVVVVVALEEEEEQVEVAVVAGSEVGLGPHSVGNQQSWPNRSDFAGGETDIGSTRQICQVSGSPRWRQSVAGSRRDNAESLLW